MTEQALDGARPAWAAILQVADQDGLNPDDYGAAVIRQLPAVGARWHL